MKKKVSIVLNVAAYWRVLLLNSLVDEILVTSNCFTKMVIEKNERTVKLTSILILYLAVKAMHVKNN